MLASPIIPTSSATVLEALDAGDSTWPNASDIDAELAALAPGHEVAVPAVLFAKVADDQRPRSPVASAARPSDAHQLPPAAPPPPPPTEPPPPPPPPLDDGAVEADAVEAKSIGAMWT